MEDLYYPLDAKPPVSFIICWMQPTRERETDAAATVLIHHHRVIFTCVSLSYKNSCFHCDQKGIGLTMIQSFFIRKSRFLDLNADNNWPQIDNAAPQWSTFLSAYHQTVSDPWRDFCCREFAMKTLDYDKEAVQHILETQTVP